MGDREFSMLDVILDPVWFWQVFGTYEGNPIRFDDWQVAHLHDYSRYRAREKAPQIGFSWLSALEAVWSCMLFLDDTTGFVSVDQREASEKVLYAKKAYAELPDAFHSWVPLAKDSTEELWFGEDARPSRLMSIPATSALRGRRMSVVLDEVDFYRDGGVDAFRIALGRVQRGGRVTMGSTCFGADTQLDRTMGGADRNFSKGRFPYVVAENPDVQAAIEIARQELAEEDFDEEYGCIRTGGAGASFTPELIREAQHGGSQVDVAELEDRAGLRAAFDVSGGGRGHPAMLSVTEDCGNRHRQIALVELRGISLPDQEKMLVELLERLPSLVLVVDAQGLGMQIGQTLTARFGERVILMMAGSKPEGLEPQDRGQMALEMQRAMEAGELEIVADRELSRQMRRTRLERSTGGRIVVTQPGSKKRTHYDKFWATAYNWYGIRQGRRTSVYENRGLRVIGSKRERVLT